MPSAAPAGGPRRVRNCRADMDGRGRSGSLSSSSRFLNVPTRSRGAGCSSPRSASSNGGEVLRPWAHLRSDGDVDKTEGADGKARRQPRGLQIVADHPARLRRFIRDYLRRSTATVGRGSASTGQVGHLKDRRDREGLVSWRLPRLRHPHFAGFADLLDIAGNGRRDPPPPSTLA